MSDNHTHVHDADRTGSRMRGAAVRATPPVRLGEIRRWDFTCVTHSGDEIGEVAMALVTKLAAPAIRSEIIDRITLLDSVSAEPHRKLTLLSAPAGWGKTTLLAQWMRRAGDRRGFAWLTLDSSDNDPSRFWSCVIAALRKANPDVGALAVELLTLGSDHLQVVVPTLLNEVAAMDNPLVLVLDDYNTVANSVVHEQVAFVIERMPATLQLVIATRSDPHLPLARLRASGELLEIRTDDLRFQAEEAEHLLTDVLGLNLTEPEVRLLLRRTEGWASGLYLAALSLAGSSDSAAFLRTFAGDNRHIVDYLMAEVLDGQPPRRRSFLLRTSVLRRLGAALCDAVLNSTGSEFILAEIERENLFLVSLDDSRHWYRYHQLFAELLQAQLQYVEPELITGLHRRAATWFTAQGLTDEAVHHLSAAGDTAGLANLVAELWVAKFNRGRLSTVSGWIDLLPYESVLADPRLSVARAWIAVNFGHLDTAGSWIEAADAALASNPAGVGVIGAEFEVLRAVYDFKVGNIGSALRRARAAIIGDVSNAPLGRPSAYCIYGSALYFCGEIREAEGAYQRASGLAEEVSDHRARVYALGYLAVIAAEDDRLADAEAFVAEAASNSRDFASGEHFVGVMVSLLAAAIIADRRGDMAAARQAADMAVVSARQGAGILELAKALAVRADILDRAGDAAASMASRLEAAAALDGLPDARLAQRLLIPAARHPPRSGQIAAVPGEQLTGKELEVLRLLATGLSRREIGDRLYVSINTVKSHQRAVYRKLGVDSSAAAARRAAQLGVL